MIILNEKPFSNLQIISIASGLFNLLNKMIKQAERKKLSSTLNLTENFVSSTTLCSFNSEVSSDKCALRKNCIANCWVQL